MTLIGLLDAALADPALELLASDSTAAQLSVSGPPGLRALAIAAVAGAGHTVLAVTSTGREAEDLLEALSSLLNPDTVALYPGWETLPHERLSPRADTVGRRLAVLRRLRHPSADDPQTGPLSVVVAPVRSVLQPQVPALGDLEPVRITAGPSTRSLEDIVAALAGAGYARVELVEKRGDFAVRGGILDIFPPTEEHPLRVEFWGDDVEEIRYFKIADQRSLEIAPDGVWAPPCREVMLTEDVMARAAQLLGQYRTDQPGHPRRRHGVPRARAGARADAGAG
jgi:transcription-repair coupling factor (superfamily II helicase)